MKNGPANDCAHYSSAKCEVGFSHYPKYCYKCPGYIKTHQHLQTKELVQLSYERYYSILSFRSGIANIVLIALALLVSIISLAISIYNSIDINDKLVERIAYVEGFLNIE